jgi:ribosomal protein S18 acetylase RimI-like enzyme
MCEFLTDLSPAAVVPAMEANLQELGTVFGQSPGVELHDDSRMLSVFTGIPHPAFNGVMRSQLARGEADVRIEEALARCKRWRVPMMWITGPSTKPADLGSRLLARGFVQEDRPGVGAEDLGMAVDLLSLNEAGPAPTDLKIQPVEEETGCRQWIEAARRGFEISQEVADSLYDLLASLPFKGPLRHFVSLRQGEAVATSSLLLGGGVAGIYNVSTVPELRRQGIGAAMVREPLRAARAMGYRVGVLMAAPMGIGVYRRIGFQEYCKFNVYLWLGASDAPAAAP